jgi:hypothetical protein
MNPAFGQAPGVLGGLMGLIRFQASAADRTARPSPSRRLHAALRGGRGDRVRAPAGDRPVPLRRLAAEPPVQQLDFFPGHHLQVLFSSQHGLFIWTLISLLAVAGFASVRDRRIQLAFLVAFMGVRLAPSSACWWPGTCC